MNFYIWSHSTDESDKEEDMKFSIKCCIGCMPYYIFGYYVYFKNRTDTPNEHHKHFILNQISYFYITSPFKLWYDIFKSLTNLFFDKMI